MNGTRRFVAGGLPASRAMPRVTCKACGNLSAREIGVATLGVRIFRCYRTDCEYQWTESTPRRSRPTLRWFADTEAYYTAVPAARNSGESDYGVWWRDTDGSTWRVSYVHATGDIYALRQTFRAGNSLVVLTTIESRPADWDYCKPCPADQLLEGWAEVCGQPASFDWVVRRLTCGVD